MLKVAMLIICIATLAGCATRGMGGADMNELMRDAARQQRQMQDNMDVMMAKQQLMQDMLSNPDLPAWHDQREKMALSLGDRQFDKDFDRVFDSMITALASLGCRVHNMERVSGYITASIPELPPEQLQALYKDGTRQYAVAKGYNAARR